MSAVQETMGALVRTVASIVLLLFAIVSVSIAQTASAQPQPAPKRPAAQPARAGSFDTLASQAKAAREGNRLDEAIRLYTKAVSMKPDWSEGYWYLGLSHYELDQYAPALDAFRRVTSLTPESADAWAFRGLCEYQLGSYEAALTDLFRSRQQGGGSGSKELVSTARYHMGILLTRNEQYEQSLQLLNAFAVEGNDSPKVIEAIGLAALRMPVLPGDLKGADRPAVMMAGRATYYSLARMLPAAQKAYEELVSRYPETPNVHYAYGVFLTGEQPDAAIEQFKSELAISPRHPLAKAQLAFEYIKRSDWAQARPWAEQVVQEAPELFIGRRALGQILLETGDVDGAILQFEAGVKQAPDSPAMRFVLSRAYRRAGRTADAEREQAEFARLDRLLRTQRTGAQSVGGMDGPPLTDEKPASSAPATPKPTKPTP